MTEVSGRRRIIVEVVEDRGDYRIGKGKVKGRSYAESYSGGCSRRLREPCSSTSRITAACYNGQRETSLF